MLSDARRKKKFICVLLSLSLALSMIHNFFKASKNIINGKGIKCSNLMLIKINKVYLLLLLCAAYAPPSA